MNETIVKLEKAVFLESVDGRATGLSGSYSVTVTYKGHTYVTTASVSHGKFSTVTTKDGEEIEQGVIRSVWESACVDEIVSTQFS